MKNNGDGSKQSVEHSVIVSEPRQTGEPYQPWTEFRGAPSANAIEKILEFPAIGDMAGVLARANFKNDRQRIAAVRLAYKNRKFKDDPHQEMLRDFCASTLGTGGLGKVMQTFVGTNLLAPDMFRAALGMPKTNKPEEVHRGSDLRAEGRDKETGDKNA